jgi:GPI mannosyltransferase 3
MSHRRRPQAAGDPDSSPYPKKKATRRPSWTVLALAVAFRAANALLVRTYFNPDEHWQCLELAHRVAFGYRIRVHIENEMVLLWKWVASCYCFMLVAAMGTLHGSGSGVCEVTSIFVALYNILALLHLDTPWFMVSSLCQHFTLHLGR